MVYTRRYRTTMLTDEFLNLLHYVSGIIGSDSYNGKSLVQEERDEERLTSYLHELSLIHRNNLTEKESIRLETAKVFTQLRNDIVPHVGGFRSPTNLFKTMAALGHFTTLPADVIELVKAKQIEVKTFGSLSDYLSIIKGSSVKDSLSNYQAYISKLMKMEKLSSFSGLHSFLSVLNFSPDLEVLSTEVNSFLKALEKSAESLPFSFVLLLSQISARLNKGAINPGYVAALNSRAEEASSSMTRDDFTLYFSLLSHTGSLSPAVVENYISQKSKNIENGVNPKTVEALLPVLKAQKTRTEAIDMLEAEFEADLGHLAADLRDPAKVAATMRRLYN